MKVIYSKAGLETQKDILIKKQKEYLEIREERKVAHDLSGDGWHDNPHFNRLQQLEASKNKELKELKEQLETATVLDFSLYKRPNNLIGIGSFIEIEILYLDSGEVLKQNWEIVCFGESNLPKQKLAYNTPLAQSIIGLQESEDVECVLPRGEALIEVLKISDKAFWRLS